jgi:hypothetical protein
MDHARAAPLAAYMATVLVACGGAVGSAASDAGTLDASIDDGSVTRAMDASPDVVGPDLDARVDGNPDTTSEAAVPSPLSGDPDASCPVGSWQTVAMLGDASAAALSGTAADDVWAVGGAVMLHFDGGSWSAVYNPLPEGGAYSGIWASAPDDAWAVAEGPTFHFDGGGWASAASPDGGAWLVFGHSPDVWLAQSNLFYPQVFEIAGAWTQLGELQTDRWGAIGGLWGASPSDVWISGSYFRSTADFPMGAFHWDGAQWTQYTLGGENYGNGGAVWGSASNDVWFATVAGVWHWDGAAIAQVPFSPPGYPEEFYAVSGTGPDDIWLAGTDVFHWDGSIWSCTAPPGVAQLVVSIWDSSPSDVWAATSTGALLHGP